MPAPNPKNFAISPAGSDLGLGDQLTEQMNELEMEQRRKRLADAQAAQMAGKPQGATPALFDLFGGPTHGT